MAAYTESWANITDAGYTTSLNTTLGKIEIGQTVVNWRSPDVDGLSPVTNTIPTIIDTQPIIAQCASKPQADRSEVDQIRDHLWYGSWDEEELLNYYIDQHQEVFNKTVYWLSKGGSLWNGGVYLACTSDGTFYIGTLWGKTAKTTTTINPVTGEMTETVTHHYKCNTLTLGSCDYLYFTQYWTRTIDGSNVTLQPPIFNDSYYNSLVCCFGNYPIPFKTGEVYDTTGVGHWEFTQTNVIGGALNKATFNDYYLHDYTEYIGTTTPVSKNSFDRGIQYRANGQRFSYINLNTRPQLPTNERWTSGNAIWTPNDDTEGSGSGQAGAPGSASGGGYNPDALDGDSVDIPVLPSKDVASSGLCGVYHLSDTNLQSLTNWLWSTNFFDSIIKNFSSPMENIVSLGLVPYSSFISTTTNITIGNVVSDITAPKLSRTMYELDCGTISVEVPYESFGSFEPFSNYSLYLPYIGVVDLPSDDIAVRRINGVREYGQINVVYHFDVFSGACVAYVRTCTNHNWNVLAQYSGNLLTSTPISQTNFLQVYQTLISTRANLSSMGANAVSTFMSGNISGVGSLANQAADTVNNAIGIRPSYARTGTLSNVHGQLAIRKPYLIKTTARIMSTDIQRDTMGYISNIPVTIGQQNGFIQCNINNIKLGGFPGATDRELDEIKSLLAMGIFIH